VILVETLAQCGGAGMVAAGIMPQGNRFYLASIHHAKFRHPVFPGDVLRIEIDVKKCTPRLLKQSGRILVNGEVAVEAEWVCMVKEE
jgi:3-hydroxyacyl-[acyl-carrier-protein] dehydratase